MKEEEEDEKMEKKEKEERGKKRTMTTTTTTMNTNRRTEKKDEKSRPVPIPTQPAPPHTPLLRALLLGERAGIDAMNSGHTFAEEPLVEGIDGGPMGGLAAHLAHDQPSCPDLAALQPSANT